MTPAWRFAIFREARLSVVAEPFLKLLKSALDEERHERIREAMAEAPTRLRGRGFLPPSLPESG